MRDLKDDFDERLKKYRDLIQRVSEPTRSRSYDNISNRSSRPLLVKPKKKIDKSPSLAPLEISGVSIHNNVYRETPPLLQPLSRSMAASSRRRRISQVIQSQELSPLPFEPLSPPPTLLESNDIEPSLPLSLGTECNITLGDNPVVVKTITVPSKSALQLTQRESQEEVFRELFNLLTLYPLCSCVSISCSGLMNMFVYS